MRQEGGRMPFRFEPNHWRERAAQMRALALDTQTPESDFELVDLMLKHRGGRHWSSSLQIALHLRRRDG